MSGLLFELKELPDLTLAKYSALGGGNQEDVLESHNGLLRMFCHKPGLSLHLLYAYNPSGVDGSKLSIYFFVRALDELKIECLDNVKQLLQSSPIAPYFTLQEKSGLSSIQILEHELLETCGLDASSPTFSAAGALAKKSAFVAPNPPHPDAPKGYYVLPEFEENSESRLYSMMKLMEALNDPVVYRVDLYPSARSSSLRASLPLNKIREKRRETVDSRNYELEGIEKSYESLMKKLDSSPLFNANVFAFSNNYETCRAILEAAASEAVKKGSVSISYYAGEFSPLQFLFENDATNVLHSVDSRYLLLRPKSLQTPQGLFVIDEDAKNYAHCDIATQFTLEEASAFFRLPVLEDGEFVQTRKETAPPAVDAKNAVYLGLDSNNQRVFFKRSLLPKHAFISGVPGSGKTNTMLHLAMDLVANDVPILVLEPAKREYRAILNKIPDVRLFAPGSNTAFPLRINPFEIPIGITVGHHINRLCQVFEGAFPLEGALPFLLDRSIEAIYRQTGWTSKMRRTGREQNSFPTLTMLYEQMETELAKESYEGEVRGNLTSAMHMRIGGLLRRELGDLFDVPRSTVQPNDWLKISAILELEALGTSQSNFLKIPPCSE